MPFFSYASNCRYMNEAIIDLSFSPLLSTAVFCSENKIKAVDLSLPSAPVEVYEIPEIIPDTYGFDSTQFSCDGQVRYNSKDFFTTLTFKSNEYVYMLE